MLNRIITKAEYALAKTFLTTKIAPNNTDFKKKHWQSAYIYPNGDIYLDNKQVITIEDSTILLKKLWLNPKYGGVGIDRFYNQVSARYFGITKQMVTNFMNNLESYQLHKRVKRAATVNPILPKGPMQYYQIDLIDMSNYKWSNNGYSWILTIIDLFTKKAYAVGLKNKEAPTVTDAISTWLQSLSIPPRVIQSDRGSEFINQQLKALLASNNIRQQLSLAHSPESQGSIERLNKNIKTMLNSYFTTYKQPIWKDILPQVIQNYNNSVHSSIGMKPSIAMHHVNTVDKRLKELANYKLQQAPKYPPLQVGDSVRLSLQTTVDYRKDTFRKKYLSQWSKEIYTISAIIAAQPLSSDRYSIRDKDGKTPGRRYFRYQLQKIDLTSLIPVETTRPDFDALFFNRINHLQQVRPILPRTPPVPRRMVTRSTTKEITKQQSYAELAAKHGLQNFYIDASIKPIEKPIDLASKYGLQNFSINVAIPTEYNK